jgi:hypothetical protein
MPGARRWGSACYQKEGVTVDPSITFTGVCDFSRTAPSGQVNVWMPDCLAPPPGLKVHLPYVWISADQLTKDSTLTNDLDDERYPDQVVAFVKGEITLDGSFESKVCDSSLMTGDAVPNMIVVAGQAAPIGTPYAWLTLSTGKFEQPVVPNPLLEWDYGVKGSPAPVSGHSLAAEHVLTLSFATPASFTIRTNRGDAIFKDPSKAAVTIGCMEVGDILSKGPYSAGLSDDDFLFHYSFVRGGIDPTKNKIPLRVLPVPPTEGKKVDCFSARWWN